MMRTKEQEPSRGRPGLTEQAKETRRAEIASIALRLFLEEGFDSVSMRRLGKEVGMTPMALYRYFPGKLDILASLWGHIIDLAFENVARLSAQASDPQERLHRICDAYVGFWRQNPDHYHLVFMSSGVTNSAVRSFVGQERVVAEYDIFFSSVAAVRAEPRSSAAVKRATDGLICTLHGIMQSLITMQGYPWTSQRDLIEDAVSAVEI